MKSCCWTEAARGRKNAAAIRREERLFIQSAMNFLDHPGFMVRVANVLGKPLEAALNVVPEKHRHLVQRATQAALKRGLEVVINTVDDSQATPLAIGEVQKNSRKTGHWHSLASFGVGAAGGLFGIFLLPVELPVTTAIMLRSIVSAAQQAGMNIRDPEVQLECLYILSLGSSDPQAVGSKYWTSRLAFAQLARETAGFLAGKTAQEIVREVEAHAAPLLVRFLTTIASRFEVVVSEKLLAEALPVVGAIGGGVINAAFTEYFSEAARFHFGLRALETRYGQAVIEQYYNAEMGAS